MQRKSSPRYRWPKQFCMKAAFWTPEGEKLEIETDLPQDLWKDIINKIVKYMKESENQ